MIVTRRTLLAGVSLLILSGCGDDSSGGANPLPTPTPSPTPTPTAYDRASDFARDRSFSAGGIIYDPRGGSRVDAENTSIGFDFTASSRTYRARYLSDTLTIATTQVVAANGLTQDQGSVGSTTFVRSPGLVSDPGTTPVVASDYTGYVLWRDNQGTATRRERALVFGARTAPVDVPPIGSKRWKGAVVTFDNGEGTVTIYGDTSVNRLSGLFYVKGSASIPFNLTVDPVTGQLSGYGGDGGGLIRGAYYGPGGSEIALVFDVTVNRFAILQGIMILKAA